MKTAFKIPGSLRPSLRDAECAARTHSVYEENDAMFLYICHLWLDKKLVAPVRIVYTSRVAHAREW